MVVHEPVEAIVGDVHARGVGIDGAEGEVLGGDGAVRQGVVQRGLADVGHTDEADLFHAEASRAFEREGQRMRSSEGG